MQKSYFNHTFFVDALFAAKQFSLTTQKVDIDIISITDNVKSTKNSYENLLRKFESDVDSFIIVTLKSVIKKIESNKNDEPVYQGQKLKYYSREI